MITTEQAPILTHVWDGIRQALTRADTPLPQRQLALGIAALRQCSPITVENTIHVAVRQGMISRTYRVDGVPKRRRAYLQWAGTVPAG